MANCLGCGKFAGPKPVSRCPNCPPPGSPMGSPATLGFTSTLATDLASDSGIDYDTLHSQLQTFEEIDNSDLRKNAIEEAQQEFHAWVGSAVFAEADDTTRGKYWEGATRYATTDEGYSALKSIAENPETTPTLRAAAGAMLLEVERYREEIRGGWVVSATSEEETPARLTPMIEETAFVSYDSEENLSSGTQVLGNSKVGGNTRTSGEVIIKDSAVDNAYVSRSQLDQARVDSAIVKDSSITRARVIERNQFGLSDSERTLQTTVEGSVLSEVAEVSGASVTASRVEGTILGSGARDAGLKNSNEASKYYQTYTRGYDSYVYSEKADSRIGQIAEEATYSKVTRSTIGKGSVIKNSHVSNSVVKDGVDTDLAVIENSTLEGTAHVRGSFVHETKKLPNYNYLEEIIPRDRRARVANVHLTREFIGEAAEVTKQSHVQSMVKDGVVITRYRTRFRGRMRRAVWAYTTTTVNPQNGSLKREFVGYDHGKESIPEVSRLISYF